MYIGMALFAGLLAAAMPAVPALADSSMNLREMLNLAQDAAEPPVTASRRHAESREEELLKTQVFGVGEIVSLDRVARLVTIRHQFIAQYDWRAGDHTLPVASIVAIHVVPTSGEIYFGLAKKSDGTIVVTALFM